MEGLAKAMAMMQQLEQRIAETLPQLMHHMRDKAVTVQMCFDHLILTILLQQSPLSFGVRVMDLFLLEGEGISSAAK